MYFLKSIWYVYYISLNLLIGIISQLQWWINYVFQISSKLVKNWQWYWRKTGPMLRKNWQWFFIHLAIIFLQTGSKLLTIVVLEHGIPELATHCCQAVFIGDSGFRFPCAHFDTADATAAEIMSMVMNIAVNMQYFGFTVMNFLLLSSSVKSTYY